MATAKRIHRVGSDPKANMAPGDVEADDEATPAETSLYDALRQALAQDVEAKEVAFEVPNRPAMSLVFLPNFDFDQYQAWMKKAEDRKSKDIDFMRLSIMVISHSNVGVRLNGQLVTHPDTGEAFRITSPEIHTFLNVPIGATGQAIKKLYAQDGHVIQTCRQIVEKAGYSMDGDVLEADEDGPLDR